MEEKSKKQLLEEIKDLKGQIKQMEEYQSHFDQMEVANWEMHKATLEKKNRELSALNKELKEENERIIAEQKRLIEQPETDQDKKTAQLKKKGEGEKLSKEIHNKYNDLLGFYIKNDRKKVDVLLDELCQHFISNNLVPKQIVNLHIISVKKIADDINQSEAQKKVYTVRMVLLMVMTKYASLLRLRVN